MKRGDEWLTIGGPLKCAGCKRHVPVYEVFQHYAIESLNPRDGSDGNTLVLIDDAELIGDSEEDHFYCKQCISKGEIDGQNIR